MVCRICAVLLAITLPVQGLAVPHYHAIGESQPDGHNERPHFHLGGHGHAHTANHGHSHHASSDSSHADKDRADDSDSHDGDAIYVVGELGLNLIDGPSLVVSTGGLILWAGVDGPLVSRARILVEPVRRTSACGDTPIFLAALSLRL